MEGQEMRGQILDMSAAYHAAMKGNWNPLKHFYSEAESKPVTLMLDTVLHIVAHSEKPELMKCLIEEVSSVALEKQNDVGNTVLYEAASSGDVEMAKVVFEANKGMLEKGNEQGETPLFGAAANGHTQMVRYLAKQLGRTPITRRCDSTSILHIAILGQYHDTALELLKLYPVLVNAIDERGLTGLHLLASMPLAFRSGCNMGLLKKLIYSCIPTVKDEATAPDRGHDVETGLGSIGLEKTRPRLPSNYRSSLDITCSLLRGLHQINVKIWDCLSYGWPAIHRVCEEKNKHELALQLVKKLVPEDKSWMDSHNGGAPHKIRIVNQGKTPESKNASRGRPANTPHAPNKPGGKGLHTPNFRALPQPVTDASPELPSSPPDLMEPPIVTKNESIQLPSKPLMGTEGRDSLQSPSHDGDHSPDFRSQRPPLETIDGGFQSPSNSSTASNDHHPLQFPPNPPMESDNDNIQSSMRSMLSGDEGFQFPLNPPPVPDDDNFPSPTGIGMLWATSNGSLEEPMNFPPMNMANPMSTQTTETPLLMAAEKGIVEIVEEILAVYPQAVEYVNDEGHNILHVAAQHRQTKIFKLICTRDTIPLIRLNRRLDEHGNSVLHQAAKRDEEDPQVDHLRNIPGEALQMQWELQWFKQVKDVMPPHFRNHLNDDGEKAHEVFTKCHKELAKNGEKWLMRTANSCSLVATLIATVAFTSAYTVPGGPNQNTGHPVLLNQPAFLFFTVSDTISLSFALTSVVVFLSIMTSRFHEQDFHLTLPFMLVIGLTSLFLAVSAMMVSFAATLVLMITQRLRRAAIPIYLVACFPVTIFLVLQFPLYVRVAWYTIGDILNKFRRSFSSHTPIRRWGLKEE